MTCDNLIEVRSGQPCPNGFADPVNCPTALRHECQEKGCSASNDGTVKTFDSQTKDQMRAKGVDLGASSVIYLEPPLWED